MADLDWLADEIGRVLWTHALDPALAAASLGLDHATAHRLREGHRVDLPADRQEHAGLLLNLLVRLEVRQGHDGGALRAAVERPLDLLGGARSGNACAERSTSRPSVTCGRSPG